MNGQIEMISIEDIIPNRFQPRLNFDDKALNELANSIKQHGLIQPLVLRKLDNKYEIISGERRYRAAQMAGLAEVPAVVRILTDQESAELAVAENVQRQDLSPIEEAKSYQRLLDTNINDHSELSQKLGISEQDVEKKMKLLGLATPVQEALLNKKISERHARSLLKLTDESDQIEMLNRIINNRLTVKQTDEAIKEMLSKIEIEPLKAGETPVGIESVSGLDEAQDLYPSQNEAPSESKPAVDINSLLMTETESENKESTLNPFASYSSPSTTQDQDVLNMLSSSDGSNSEVISNESSNKEEVNVPVDLFATPNTSSEPSNTSNMNIPINNSNNFNSQINPFQETEILDLSMDSEQKKEEKNMYENNVQIKENGNNDIIEHDLNSVITKARDFKNIIEAAGFVVETEEYDFAETYQITFKIQK